MSINSDGKNFNMGIKRLTGFLLIILILGAGIFDRAAGEVYLTMDEALKLAFPGADRIVKKSASG